MPNQLLLSLGFLIFTPSIAQKTTVVVGRVLDLSNKAPLTDAMARLLILYPKEFPSKQKLQKLI